MKQLFILLILVLACSMFATADLMEGLVLYMPLDEGTGNRLMTSRKTALQVNLTAAPSGLMVNSERLLNSARPGIFVAVADNKLSTSKMKSHKPHGLILTGCRVHTLSFSAPAPVAVQEHRIRLRMNPGNGIKVWTNGAGWVGFLDINDNKNCP